MWRPKPGSPVDKDSELELEDTQRVQRFKVRLLQITHALDVNLANLASLRRAIAIFRRKTKDYYITESQHKKYDEELEDLHILMTQHRVRVKNLLQRAESLFSLIITIIPYIFARRENTLMFRLSEKAAQYGQSMKVITVVCMLYLPPSIITVCHTWQSRIAHYIDSYQGVFGMGFFNSQTGQSAMWVRFFVATVALTVLTIGLWLVWERRLKRDSQGGGGYGDAKPEVVDAVSSMAKVTSWVRWWRRKSRQRDEEHGHAHAP